MAFCTKCGSKINDEALFCTVCGAARKNVNRTEPARMESRGTVKKSNPQNGQDRQAAAERRADAGQQANTERRPDAGQQVKGSCPAGTNAAGRRPQVKSGKPRTAAGAPVKRTPSGNGRSGGNNKKSTIIIIICIIAIALAAAAIILMLLNKNGTISLPGSKARTESEDKGRKDKDEDEEDEDDKDKSDKDRSDEEDTDKDKSDDGDDKDADKDEADKEKTDKDEAEKDPSSEVSGTSSASQESFGTGTVIGTETGTPEPSKTETPEPAKTASPTPTETPSPTPTATASPTPTDEPTPTEKVKASVSVKKASEVSLGGYSKAGVSSASASSELVQADRPDISNAASKAVDGDVITSWQEAVNGYGIGEFIDVNLNGKYNIRAITFNMGNWRDTENYKVNARPKDITIWLGSESFKVTIPDGMVQYCVEFSTAVTADKVTVRIESVYTSGVEYDDTCISEMTVYAEK